ncbi:MAG: hypothetical protein WC503_04640 [Candidatus Shapirobacteria bacterium]
MSEQSINLQTSRSFLTVQNHHDLPPLSPEISPHVHTEAGPEYLEKFRQITTYAGDHPYQNAVISLETISSSDNPDKIFLTQSYVQESRINNLAEYASWLRYLGVDFFNLSGKISVTDDFQKTIAQLEPPVFEEYQNGDKKLISGHHRYLLSCFLDTPINCVVIRNFDESQANPFEPIPLLQVKVAEGIPNDSQKRHLIDGKRYTESVDPSSFGDESVRTSNHYFDRRFQPYKIDISPTADNRQALSAIKNIFEDLFQTPDFFSGIISGPETNSDFPNFARLSEVIDIGGGRSQILFDLTWSDDGQKIEKPFKIIVENPDFIPKYSVAYLLPPDIKMASTEPVPVGKITDKNIVVDNSPYFTTEKYTIADGSSFPVTINDRTVHHPELLPEEFITHGEASVFIIRDGRGNFVLANEEYRPSIGITLKYNPPRCFGFKPERIEDNIGIDLHSDQFIGETTMIADPSRLGDYSRIDIYEVSVEYSQDDHSSKKTIEDTKEFVEPKIISPTEVYEALRYGEIVDNISQASLFFALLKDGHLKLNDSLSDQQIVFTDFYDYLHQQHRLILPYSPVPVGHRIGGFGFSDTGKSWISSMTTISPLENISDLPNKSHFQTLTLRETVDSILSGKFDLETMAHLSRVFINHNLATFSPSLTA